MKKLMTSTIIFLPLLLLAIMLVSGAIMSLVTHIYVESVEFVESETLVLVMDDEAAPPEKQLEVNVLPLKAENRTLVYTTADDSIASVDENGVVTAKFYGETYITVVSAENAAATARRKVLVTDSTVHALRITEFTDDMYRGESQTLPVEVLPYEANNKKVAWSTSDADILSVTQSGEVTCMGAGKAIVTVSSVEKPEVKAFVEITCHEPLGGITADTAEVITAERVAQFPAITVNPENATYTVAYSSSDESVATVDSTGRITFLQSGAAEITATVSDGREHTYATKVQYRCTDGYFMGRLFKSAAPYSFDYDTYAGKYLTEIEMQKAPAGSYRKIVGVSFSREGILAYELDEPTGTLKFKLDPGFEGPLGDVVITVKAEKYDYETNSVKAYEDDKCTVTLTRKTQSLSFGWKENQNVGGVTINTKSVPISEFAAEAAASGIVVIPSPANHTDHLSYSIASGDASIQNGNTLVFGEGESRAVLRVTASDGNGENFSATLTVNYVKKEAQDTEVKLGEESEYKLALDFTDASTKDRGLLYVETAPAGHKAHYEADGSGVVTVETAEGSAYIVPQKGGFATVTVTFVPDAASSSREATPVYTIKVYVDRPVEAQYLSFDVREKYAYDGHKYYLTAKDSVNFTVTLTGISEGAMEGKELYINDRLAAAQDGTFIYAASEDFASSDTLTLTAEVRYVGQVAEYSAEKTGVANYASSSCEVKTTRGELYDAPKLTCSGADFLPESVYTFDDLGATMTCQIDASSAKPNDFAFTSEDQISLSGAKYVKFEVTDYNGKTARFTLTSTGGGEEDVVLTVAGQTFTIKVRAAIVAHEIAVKYDQTPLERGADYTTLLSTLPVTVTLSRTDNKDLTDRSFTYTYGGQRGTGTSGTPFNLTPTEGANTVTVTAGGEKATFTFTLQKVELSALALQYHIEYQANAHPVVLDPFEAGDTVEFTLPKGVTAFDICVTLPSDLHRLGGYEEDAAQAFFTLTQKEGWSALFHTATGKLEITTTKDYYSGEELTVNFGEESVTLRLNCVNLSRVELVGFDSTNTVNGGDVYKGYQQVRVFAKQSDYGDGNKVDYYRIPYNAEGDLGVAADPGDLTWTLTKHNDSTNETETIVQQHGPEVNYNGVLYTIEKTEGEHSVLKKKEGGAVIAQNGKYAEGAEHVPWVDVYAKDTSAEESSSFFADLYFGSFVGLTETDVQNDLFGNFGEKEGWAKPAGAVYDIEGKTVTPSAGAYTYLRVSAGNGAKDDAKTNVHFNFNVLEDATLVNVFNAEGYYRNSKIVLHNNLYGGQNTSVSAPTADLNCNENELTDEAYTKAKKDDLILDKAVNDSVSGGTNNTSYAGKNTIYGNGYQINLNALNTMIIGSKKFMNNNKGTENTGNRSIFSNIYNVILKGRNDTDTVVSTRMGIYFDIKNAYYSTVQNYGKLFNGSFHAKNSVFRNVAMAAIELWDNRDGAKASCVDYLENVTIVNAKRAIILENHGGHTLNIKGYFDALNYNSLNEIQGLASEGLIDDAMVLQLLFGSMAFNEQSIDKYMEWFGRNYNVSLMNGQMGGANNFFVNPMIIDLSQDEGKTKIVSQVQYSSYAKGKGWFYLDENGNTVAEQSYYDKMPSNKVWQWQESTVNVGGVGGVINVWDESQNKYVDRKTNPGNSNFATPLSGLDHVDPRYNSEDALTKHQSQVGSAGFGNTIITGYTYNKPNSVDGGQCTVSTIDPFRFNATVSRSDLGKLLNAERDIRLLCEYVDIDPDGTPILNTDHILWHMQKAHRDLSLINGREENHNAALKESLIKARDEHGWDGVWPDETTLQNALDAAAPALAMNELLSSTVLPSKRPY